MRREGRSSRITHHASRITFLLFPALAAAFLAPALFGSRALLPTGLLMGMSPWAQATAGTSGLRSPAEPWNPILWDAVAQFYPWRAFAAHWVRRGIIPLWDPHQFCGTPFLANSQSAVLYPLHLLLLDLSGLPVARAMALLAAVHMALAGSLTFLWLRALRLSPFAAALGGMTFMLSGFAVTWLELPSFLTVACWLPLLFLTLHRVLERPTALRLAAAAVAVGLTLLGGHLQIAFYCLLGAGLYALWVLGKSGPRRTPNTRVPAQRVILGTRAAGDPNARQLMVAGVAALALGVMLAAPQMLPAMELSRFSHRAGSASAAGYEAYIRGAMPAAQLVRLFLPDFYGNPNRGDYIAGSPADYTEFAGYFGSVGLLLALAALLAWRGRPRETVFAAGLAALSLLLALGTRLNRLFYFGIPGFSQSGSPARILVLFCFAGAWLAALGAEALTAPSDASRGLRDEEGLIPTHPSSLITHHSFWLPLAALALWAALLGMSLLLARAWVEARSADFGPLLALNGLALRRAGAFALLAAGLPVGLQWLSRSGSFSPMLADMLGRGVLAALVLNDLWLFGAGFNPTGPLAEVYPRSPLIDALRTGPAAGPGRILPVNTRWSLTQHPHAVLPPNSALALGLTDPQGYDSLFIGRYKGFANLVQDGDTAPPENGNMLFLSNLGSPLLPLLAADRVVSSEGAAAAPIRPLHGGHRSAGVVLGTAQPPGRSPALLTPPWPVLYDHAGLRVYRCPSALPRAFVASAWRTVSDDAAPAELQRLAAARSLGATALVAASEAPGARRQAPAGLPGSAVTPDVAGLTRHPASASRAMLSEAGPNQVTLTLPNAEQPGTRAAGDPNTQRRMLVLLDSFYPGWRAADLSTGQPLPLHRADLTFRGIPLSDGLQQVRLRYQPASFRFGLYLALLALAVLSALAAPSAARDRR